MSGENLDVLGRSKGKMSKATGCLLASLLAVLALVVSVGVWATISHPAPPPSSKGRHGVDPEIAARVSAEQAVRSLMNDPRSYQYMSHTIRTVPIAEGMSGYEVELVFRGKNAFGGVVINSAKVTTDGQGLIVLGIE